MFRALAEFERDLIRKRTQAGLVAARARGRLGGRPRGLSTQAEATALAAETLYREGRHSVRQIAAKLHIAKSTLYVYLRARGIPIGLYTTRALVTTGAATQVVGAGGAHAYGRPEHAARPQPRTPDTPSHRERAGEAVLTRTDRRRARGATLRRGCEKAA